MLDALVDREDGEVAATRHAPMAVHGLQRTQHAGLAVFLRHHPIHVIRPGQMKHVFRNALALVGQQRFGFVAEQLGYIGHHPLLFVRIRLKL